MCRVSLSVYRLGIPPARVMQRTREPNRWDSSAAANLDNEQHSKAPFFLALYGVQAWKGQSQRFVPPVHAVERLHCIAGSAFHQVIQGSDDHYALLVRIEFKTNIAIVAPYQNLRFGIAVDAVSFFDQANERFILVDLAKEPPQSALVYILVQEDMGRNKHPAH